ncbi:Uncharacterised protein [Vibrio cholerae]|nr:Uncharacterised protein [Vibrio cholerae]CSI45715.1 Uncharacterised protein [Vibrio cholerae]
MKSECLKSAHSHHRFYISRFADQDLASRLREYRLSLV